MRRMLILSLGCALMATTAQGQGKPGSGNFLDPIVMPRVVQETFQAIVEAPTTGYIGLTASSSSFTGDGSFSASVPVATFPAGDSRLAFGLTAGARNVTTSGLFVGGEVFMNQGSNSTRKTDTYFMPSLPGVSGADVDYTQTFRIGREIGARLLMGVEMDELRLYGSLGAANATATIAIETPSEIFGNHTASVTGRVLGAGIEYDVTRNTTIRGELSRTNYGRTTYAAGGSGSAGRHSVNMSRTNASIGLFLRN
ncbi:MAG: outer membrane beta-barrel protein [Rhodobacteraceae bacterium]|nr:outer membrane beta-barrel protein [Paracoccaceae bacterium]